MTAWVEKHETGSGDEQRLPCAVLLGDLTEMNTSHLVGPRVSGWREMWPLCLGTSKEP
jgi:hypothetical protein